MNIIIMVGKYHAVFVWFLLTNILSLQIVVGANVREKIFNVENIAKSLKHFRSISIDGKTIELDEWMSHETDKDSDRNSKIIYTFLKCECVYFISHSIDHIQRSLHLNAPTPLLNKRKMYYFFLKRLSEKKYVPLLRRLNENITLATAILFEISDERSSVKSTEPYFLKTLLMTSFYVDILTSASAESGDNEATTAATLAGSRRRLPPRLYEDKSDDDEDDSIAIQIYELTTPEIMNRVLLQINNLIQHFSIRHCNSNPNNGVMNFDLGLEEFHSFLMAVVSREPNPFDMARVMLKTRMLDSTQSDSVALLFEIVLKNSKIVLSSYLEPSEIQDGDENQIYIHQLFAKAQSSHDFESIYRYMFAVYKVILKSICRKAYELWDNQKNVDVQWFEEVVVSKIRSMHCPNEMMELFEFILQVERYRTSNDVGMYNRARSAACTYLMNDYLSTRLEKVYIPENEMTPITFESLTDVFFHDEFKSFWQVFSLLHKESEMKSLKAYDFSLNVFPEAIFSVDKTNSTCDSLSEVYYTFLKTLILITDCVKSEIGEDDAQITDLSSGIRDSTQMLYTYLLTESDKFIEHVWTDNNPLLNIYLAMAIQLNKEIYFDLSEINNEHCVEDLKTVIIRKKDNLSRIIDIFLNLLDNYQIRNCKVMENYGYQYIIFNEGIFKSHSCSELRNNSTIHLNQFPSEKIPSRFYDFNQLIGNNNAVKVKYYGTEVFFHWNGENKSMHQIQMDVSVNMSSTHDLVAYQRIYTKFMFWVSYKALFLNAPMVKLKEIFSSYENYPEPFRIYLIYCQSIFHFYLTIYEYDEHGDAIDNSELIGMVKKELISSVIDSLGIEKGDSKNLLDVNQNESKLSETFESIFDSIDQVSKTIREDFVFIE